MIDVRHVDKHTYVNVAPSRGMMTVPDDRHTVCCRPHIHFSRHDDGKRCLEYGMMTLYVNVFESTKCSYTKQKPVVLILPPEERNFFHLGWSDISKKNFFFQEQHFKKSLWVQHFKHNFFSHSRVCLRLHPHALLPYLSNNCMAAHLLERDSAPERYFFK